MTTLSVYLIITTRTISLFVELGEKMKHLVKITLSVKGQRRITLPSDLCKHMGWSKSSYAIVSGKGRFISIEPLDLDAGGYAVEGSGVISDNGGGDD